METQPELETFWSLPVEEVARRLEVDSRRGLSADEARRRLEQFGLNQLREAERRGPLRLFLSQFANLMIALLVVAAVISALIGEWADSLLIAVIVLANAAIGFVQEWRAEKAVEALRKLSEPTARVWRDGRLAELPADRLVPGDLIELLGGSFVPADARVVEAAELQAAEAALTGESLPVDKLPVPQPQQTPLPDRHSMVYAGTAITQGHGRAIVTGTGMQTELGKIASLLESAEQIETPLQHRLSVLSKRLAVAVLLVCLLVFAAGILREGRENWDRELFNTMLLTAVSLAVAAIPEGLPAVITIALARGSQKMSRRNAIVRRLAAVETLGSVDVICSDKTGTLTQNRMAVADLVPTVTDEDALENLLWAGVLCNDAEISDTGDVLGSATEAAILEAAVGNNIDPETLRSRWQRLDEIPFNSTRKRMSTLHRGPDGRRFVFVKGAVEAICSRSTQFGKIDSASDFDDAQRSQWLQRADQLAERGRRVLAIAVRNWEEDRLPQDADAVESSLTLLGIVGIIDPVRPEARESIARCRSAGIRPVMITGDHRGTARSIAEELDLWRPGDEVVTGVEIDQLDDEALSERIPRVAVFARVSPEHKIRIVRAIQSRGGVVSMTGDGVNDAPALKQADIGVAMGITGTDVAKEAAEMILADDNFASIVAAVEEGRVVYDNIRKFVQYLLTANTGEVLVLVLAIVLGFPLPLLPVHILWINLVTDGLPALALGFEPAERDVMQRKPRRREESIFADGMVGGILSIGLLMGVACVALFHVYVSGLIQIDVPAGADPQEHTLSYARSMVFLTLSMFQLFYVLAIRSSSQSLFELGLWSNYRLNGAVVIGTVLQCGVIYFPPLQPIFHTTSLAASDLLIGLSVSLAAFVAVEIWKLQKRMRGI